MNDAERTALFEKGVALNERARSAKARETELARIQVKARVQAEYDARNTFYAALVDDHGFSIAAIGRIMGTSNRATMRDAIDAGRRLRGATPDAPPAAPQDALEKYTYDDEERLLTVRLAYEDFRPYLAALPTEPSEAGEEYTFRFDGDRLTPVEDEWDHPVVALMMHEKTQKDAIEWIRNR